MRKSERKMQKSVPQDQSRDPMRTEDRFADKTQQLEKSEQAKEEGQTNQSSQSEQTDQTEVEVQYCSKRIKIIIAIVSIVSVLATTGILVGLLVKFKTKVEPIGSPTMINLSDGNGYVIGQYRLQDKNLFDKDVDLKLLIHGPVFSSQQITKQPQLNQETIPRYSVKVNLDDVGFKINLDSNDKITVEVNPQRLQQYIVANDPQAARLLNEINETAIEDDGNMTIEELKKQLSDAFNSVFQTSEAFDFKQKSFFKLALNETTSKFEVKMQGNTSPQTRRRLYVRLLFLNFIFNKIKDVIKQNVSTVIEIVRDYGSEIGTVAGGLIGGVVGLLTLGPAGAIALGIKGAQIGGFIGLGAQTIVKACVPEDTVAIDCQGQKIASAVFDTIFSITTAQICAMTICPMILGKVVSTAGLK